MVAILLSGKNDTSNDASIIKCIKDVLNDASIVITIQSAHYFMNYSRKLLNKLYMGSDSYTDKRF